MPSNPIRHAAREIEMDVWLVQFSHAACGVLENLAVAMLRKPGLSQFEEAGLKEWKHAGAANPPAHEHEFVRSEIRTFFISSDDGHQFLVELGRDALICVEMQNPPMLERDIFDRPVALLRERVERPLKQPHGRFADNGNSIIRTQGVEDDHVIACRERSETSPDIGAFIECEN